MIRYHYWDLHLTNTVKLRVNGETVQRFRKTFFWFFKTKQFLFGSFVAFCVDRRVAQVGCLNAKESEVSIDKFRFKIR